MYQLWQRWPWQTQIGAWRNGDAYRLEYIYITCYVCIHIYPWYRSACKTCKLRPTFNISNNFFAHSWNRLKTTDMCESAITRTRAPILCVSINEGKFQSETIDAALRPIAFHFHHAYICWLSHVHSIWLYSQLHSRSSPLHSVGFESSSFNLRAGTKNEFGLAFKPSQMGNERTPTLPPSEINMPRTFKHWSDITAHEKSGAENVTAWHMSILYIHFIYIQYMFRTFQMTSYNHSGIDKIAGLNQFIRSNSLNKWHRFKYSIVFIACYPRATHVNTSSSLDFPLLRFRLPRETTLFESPIP